MQLTENQDQGNKMLLVLSIPRGDIMILSLQSVPGRVEGSVHPYVLLFQLFSLQMRAKVPQDDPPSQSCSLMNSLRPAALHMLNFWLWNHISANLLPRRYSVQPPPPPRGQGLGCSLPLQTKSLMARNSWDAFHKSCRFANCMHFRLFSQNS